jgi:hypothetical protein
VRDGDETDVDCGGSCPACDDGSACVTQGDCASQVCAGLVCQAPRCDDQIQNGDEAGIDCGGSACGFCQSSPFWPELDDYQGTPATLPQVAIFADHSFAITYNGPDEARVRWFNELGSATGPSVDLSDTVSFIGQRVLPLVAGTGDGYPIHALEPGTDPLSVSTDLFLIRRTHATELANIRINPVDSTVSEGGLAIDGTTATLSWRANTNQILTRRLDYNVGDGAWTDIAAFHPEPEPAVYSGQLPIMARNSAGMTVLAWLRCELPQGEWCDVALRRFDGGWIDPEPVLAGVPSTGWSALRVAISEDGRVGVSWTRLAVGQTSFVGWILDADLVAEGPSWDLQTDITDVVNGDVAALDDGSFAFAWPDNDQDRVHLRRYLSTDLPKLPDVGDESPWGSLGAPQTVDIANRDKRAVILWSAMADGVSQIQGQALSY